jgi:O-antigen ligase
VALFTPARAIPRLMIERWQSYGSELSNVERLRYAVAAGHLVADGPLLGAGIGNFAEAFRIDQHAVLGPKDPHDVYLAVGADAGLPALVSFVLFLSAVLFAAYAAVSRVNGREVRLRAGLLGSVAALVVLGLVSSEPLSARTAWVLLSCALVSSTGCCPESAASA